MVNNQRITLLLQQFADGSISKADYTELITYFNLSGNDDEIFAAMDEVWKNISTESAEEFYTAKEADQFYHKLTNEEQFIRNRNKQSLRLWYRIAAAAVVLVTLSTGLFFLKSWTDHSGRWANIRKNDIAPAGNKAILTLADGRKISLSDASSGKLAEEAGISIEKNADGHLVYQVKKQQGSNGTGYPLNTITTPRGGQYQVNLPDGTRVWLNTASSLKFPVQFDPKVRKVILTGEAYFEVAKNKHQPFKVVTAKQEVEVLGTHFNVDSYDDEAVVKTTLLEGSVRVTFAQGNVVIKPNEQAQLSGNRFAVKHVDTEEALAWKNGFFMFSGQDLEGIMKQVERWYDVDVVFEDKKLKKQVFNGAISRFKNISSLLEVLESTGSVQFKIEGRRVIAMQ